MYSQLLKSQTCACQRIHESSVIMKPQIPSISFHYHNSFIQHAFLSLRDD